MCFFFCLDETKRTIEVGCSFQFTDCPEKHPLITRLLTKIHSLPHETLTQPRTATIRMHQQPPQLSLTVRVPHNSNRTNNPPIQLRNPNPLPNLILRQSKLTKRHSHIRLKTRVKPKFPSIQNTMKIHNIAQIPRPQTMPNNNARP